MSDDIDINNFMNEYNKLNNENTQLKSTLAATSFQPNQDNNAVQYQLECEEILDKLQHFYRGDEIVVDADGNVNYVRQKDKAKVLLNDFGINELMSILNQYVNKNTMLSFYDEMRLNEILADLGDELAKHIFCNYDGMGMDTPFKKSRYNLIVVNTLHVVESSYRRALRGNTQRELNTSRLYTQTENMGMMQQQIKKKFSLFNPKTW